VENFKALFKSVRDRAPHPAQRDQGALSHVTATWVNVAVSFEGLRRLSPTDARRFPNVFRTNRVPGATTLPDVHALLIVAADLPDDLDSELHRQREHMQSMDAHEVTTLCGATLPRELRGQEHFGFKDVVSQPRIAGLDGGSGPPLAAGEFVLGYPDQSGHDSGAGRPAWARNGSFVAFLQLQQHVATFWNTMNEQAKHLGAQPDDVASWIVGRKQDGTPLVDPPSRRSHIGRAYARWLPAGESLRHRVLRRGLPYGPPWDVGEPDDAHDRGLLFVTYQADLERQFEHVWSRWLNASDFPSPGSGRDPLAGQTTWLNQATPGGKRRTAVSRGRDPAATLNMTLPAFVTPRTGGYFFAPSIAALSSLAE
jgi:Dyp-type peroxidase family